MDKSCLYTETDRLIIRNFVENDVLDYYEYLSDPVVLKYEPYEPLTLKQVKKNILNNMKNNDMLAIELKSNHKMIGNIYFSDAENNNKILGYILNKNYWGQGFATEAVRTIIDLAFKNNIQRIEAKCDPLNIPSWKLLESVGFTREAHLKHNVYFWKDEHGNPIWKDTYVYSIMNSVKLK